jgi:hypothetical protein
MIKKWPNFVGGSYIAAESRQIGRTFKTTHFNHSFNYRQIKMAKKTYQHF